VKATGSIGRIQSKLKKVKDSLKGWGQYGMEFFMRKKELMDELANLEILETKLMKIYEEEEMYWSSRSSERLLMEGDNNTSYFHRIANGRKRENTTYSLKR
jgi:hypothetical protein